MKKTVFRVAVSVLLVAAVAAGGMTLLAKPDNPRKGGFKPCPFPPCMAPCTFPAPEEVACKMPDGTVEKTSYFCCCCGGGGNYFKWLN
jgi:hypothetical protein